MKKYISPNKLPFLQSQILQSIYIDIFNGQISSIENIAELTGYKQESKILNDAINALIKKGFLNGDIEKGFFVPEERNNLYSDVIKENDYQHKEYATNILQFRPTNRNNNFQQTLFDNIQTVSDMNKEGVCHRWYDYLEDFPYSLIEKKIKKYHIGSDALIVEPFAGSGTTNLTAKFFNINSIGFDANPLMVFISEAKTTWDIDLPLFKKITINIAQKFIDNIKNYDSLELKKGFLEVMPKKELNQWLSPGLQKEANLLRNYIREISVRNIRNLLLLALSKSCIEASYVSFCPGTTFYPFRKKEKFWDLFTNKLIDIYDDLKKVQHYQNYGKAKFINDTCLNAQKHIQPNSIDFIITSPPYPNDLEYTRQTRLEMYLLDFVRNMSDIQQIKKRMVKGSTKLIYKESDSEKFVTQFESVRKVSDQIYEQTKDKNWGFDYPRMVREYFGDMYLCMKAFFPLMKAKSHFLLVVGDQTIKGVYIPVCDILIEMGNVIGYENCSKELFRIRRSTGHNIELPEEIVILEKGKYEQSK